MSFAGKERDVLVADANRGQIVLIQDVFGAAGALSFGSLPDGVTTPVGLAVSPDETHAFVADKASKRIAVYEMETRNVIDQIPLDAEPAFVKRFSRDSLFLLNSGASGTEPFQLLETGDKPSVYFVPAGATQSQ
jgi:DNA-binding beta-propeller fold protein YncE